MKTSWEYGPAYCQITKSEVVVGSNPGKTGHTDNAGSCSHAEFLGGQYHDLIKKDLGEEVLQEVIASVQAVMDEEQDA